MILHAHKLIITPTRRVAGTSIISALRPYLSAPEDGDRFNLGTLSGSMYGSSYPQHGDWAAEVADGPYREYLKVLVVRNPFEKLLSGYYFVRSSGRYPIPDKGFCDFVLQRDRFRPVGNDIWLWDHTWRTTLEVAMHGGVFAFDQLIRYEQLEQDFRRICEAVGIPATPLPHENRSTHPPAATVYDGAAIESVRQHFSADLVRFRYEFPNH